jgi:hypothetical protein
LGCTSIQPCTIPAMYNNMNGLPSPTILLKSQLAHINTRRSALSFNVSTIPLSFTAQTAMLGMSLKLHRPQHSSSSTQHGILLGMLSPGLSSMHIFYLHLTSCCSACYHAAATHLAAAQPCKLATLCLTVHHEIRKHSPNLGLPRLGVQPQKTTVQTV